MSKKPYTNPEYWRDLHEIVVLQEFLDDQMSAQFSEDEEEIEIYNPKASKSETTQIPTRIKIKNKITWSLKSYDLNTADKEYWNKRIAFTKKYPKFDSSYLDEVKYENLPHKHIRILKFGPDNDSYDHIWYNGKDIHLNQDQGIYIYHVHQKYLRSGNKFFNSGEIISKLPEIVFKDNCIDQLFQNDEVMNNLIKSVGTNNSHYKLDVDF